MVQSQRHGGEGPKLKLVAEIDARLGKAMGGQLSGVARLAVAFLALAWLVLAGIAVAFLLSPRNDAVLLARGHGILAVQNLWLGLHFAAQIVLARLATRQVRDIIEHDIQPYASKDFQDAVRGALRRQTASRLFQILPYPVAAIALVAAFLAIRPEIPALRNITTALSPDALFWVAASFYTYYSCVRVVRAAAFTRAFADALEAQKPWLYPLRAAQSPIVRGLARLNRAVLGYFVFFFLIFATVMLLVLPPEQFGLARNSPFLIFLVPVVAFLSLGVGAYFYLKSESVIAAILRRYSIECAAPLRGRIKDLLPLVDPDAEETVARVNQLGALHDQIIAGGEYGSRTGTAISLLLPFAMPALGQLERLFPRLFG